MILIASIARFAGFAAVKCIPGQCFLFVTTNKNIYILEKTTKEFQNICGYSKYFTMKKKSNYSFNIT